MLDTNVCLDLFVFDDPRCADLRAALREGRVEAVTRDDCRAEWLAVLAYPRLALAPERRAQAAAAFDACVRCLRIGHRGQLQEFLIIRIGAARRTVRDPAAVGMARNRVGLMDR